MTNYVKQDLNFLDKFLWLPAPRKKPMKNPVLLDEKGRTVIDQEGYTYRFLDRPPEKFDMLVFLYTLLQSQKEGYKRKMEFTRYEILKGCGYPTDPGYYYNRLEDCLERWMNVTVTFKGTFYDGKEYQFLSFHIVDHIAIDKKAQKVTIVFNETWLEKIKNSNFFKYIPFEFYKALKRPVSRRLFEILFPKFYYNRSWGISLVNLAKKIGLPGSQVKTKDGYKTAYYPSTVLRTILPCIKELNSLLGDRRKLKSLALDEKHTFLVEYELFVNSEGEKSIRFIKKKLDPEPLEEPAEDEIPERILDLVTLEYIKKKWEEAISWLDDLREFESCRLREAKRFPKYVVALIYDRVRWKYENGKIKTMGGIYRAFKKGWYLQDVILTLEEKKRRMEKERERLEAEESLNRIQERVAKPKQEEAWKKLERKFGGEKEGPKSIGEILKEVK